MKNESDLTRKAFMRQLALTFGGMTALLWTGCSEASAVLGPENQTRTLRVLEAEILTSPVHVVGGSPMKAAEYSAVSIPLAALIGGNNSIGVVVLRFSDDSGARLQARRVEVITKTTDSASVRGLREGDKILLEPRTAIKRLGKMDFYGTRKRFVPPVPRDGE